jgi:ribosomal protein S12 methylthiotransferase accessory factor YcaO
VTRLRLREDAYYAQTSDGITVLTNSGPVILTGPSIFQWVDRLAPYLDGTHTLAELTATMPAARKEMTERIVQALREQHVIVDADGTEARGHLLTSSEQVTLVGAGRMLVEVAEAVKCSGARQLRVVATGDLADDSQLSAAVDGSAIVIHACDRPAVDEARALDRACARLGVPFASAMLVGDGSWFGPFGDAAGSRPDWMSAWRRLAALDGEQQEPVARDGPATTVVANQFIRQVVRLVTGTAEQAAQAEMARVDLLSLGTQRHRFLPHPFELPALPQDQASLLATVRQLSEGEPVDADEFSRRAAACVQDRLGVLGEVTEQDFTQIPLAVSQVEVSDPALLLGPETPRPLATGAGLSLADARRAAVLRGLAVYASLMVDPRRLHVGRDAADPRTGDPDEDLKSLREQRWDGYVWGYGLADGLSHEIPATAVFPALRGVGPAYLPPAGAAAGYDWREAVRRGLAGECRRLTIAEVVEGRTGLTAIEWTDVVLDDRGELHRSMVKIIGEGLDVYDVTGSAGVPTLAFCLDDVTVAYASGFSFAQALSDGLAEVLLRHQAEASGQTAYAPPGVPELPGRERPSRRTACPDWSTDDVATATRLGHLGWTAVAVPLDHDPALATSVLPYLVNVVLTRA